jgi:hypothetical protein
VRNQKIKKATQPALHKPGISGAIIISVYFTAKGKEERSRFLKKLNQ